MIFSDIYQSSVKLDRGDFSLLLSLMLPIKCFVWYKWFLFYRIHRRVILSYADDLLLIRRTKAGLACSVRSVADAFARIGLLLNVDKCEFLIYNGVSSPHPLDSSSFSVPQVTSF